MHCTPFLRAAALALVCAMPAIAARGNSAQAPGAEPRPAAPAPVEAREVPLYARVVVIGSESSHGAAWAAEVGATVSLADVVEQAILCRHGAVARYTDSSAGRDALVDLERQARLAKGDKPTLVVALDSLAMAVHDAGDAAPARFERALAALKGIGAPLLVGDLPDWGGLAQRSPGGFVDARKLPSPQVRARLTERLAAFARDEKDVVVAPVSRLWSHLERDEPLKARGNLWGRAWLPDLAAKDRLALRLDGGIALWVLAADALCRSRVDAPADVLVFDARELRRRVYASRAKEREAAEAAELEQQRGPVRPPPPPPPTPAEQERAKREKAERQGREGG
jgi:hypothetical protein